MNLSVGIMMLSGLVAFCCSCAGGRIQMDQSSWTDVAPFIAPTMQLEKLNELSGTHAYIF